MVGLKYNYYINCNSLKHKFEKDTIQQFSLLPELSFYYDSKGFFEFGPCTEHDWCKELSINLNFLIFRLCVTFWYDFYKE